MKQKVLSWLNAGASAKDGLHLMEQSGANRHTLRMIRTNPVANKRLMVEYLCQKYNIAGDHTVAIIQPEITVTKKQKSFRDEFPFLNEKSCPVELETLASRKFASYYRYIDLHKELRNCTSLEQCAAVSKELIDNYLDNRLIWEELNYYHRHKSLLGKHPIFQEFLRRRQLLHMSVKELVFRQQQIKDNIWRVNNELKKGNKPYLDKERNERLARSEAELEEVNRLLE